MNFTYALLKILVIANERSNANKNAVSDYASPARLSLLFSLAFISASCSIRPAKEPSFEATSTLDAHRYPGIDTQLGEHLFPDEKAIAEQLSVVLGESVRKQYAAGSARRDAHPKAHGCVKAEIQIVDSLPENVSRGIFISGKTYQAWIRFSNGSGDPTHADIKRDARGIAIKVLGVPRWWARPLRSRKME